jgi:hypothetical protein
LIRTTSGTIYDDLFKDSPDKSFQRIARKLESRKQQFTFDDTRLSFLIANPDEAAIKDYWEAYYSIKTDYTSRSGSGKFEFGTISELIQVSFICFEGSTFVHLAKERKFSSGYGLVLEKNSYLVDFFNVLYV